MNIDAALTLFSLVSFALLVVSWMIAPVRADSPAALPIADAGQPVAVAN